VPFLDSGTIEHVFICNWHLGHGDFPAKAWKGAIPPLPPGPTARRDSNVTSCRTVF